MHYFYSSAICAALYIENSMTLLIQFTSGGNWYDYNNVPAHIYDALIHSQCAEEYFNLHIREQYTAENPSAEMG